MKVAVEADAPESPAAEAGAPEVDTTALPEAPEVGPTALPETPRPPGGSDAATPEADRDEPKRGAATDLTPAARPASEMLDVEAESPIMPGSVAREES